MEPQASTPWAAGAAPAVYCCPPFDPRPWDEQELVWAGKPFVKEHVRALFHIPLHIGAKITHAKALIDAAGAGSPQPLMLYDDLSPWGAVLYIDVTGDVPGAVMTNISGTFLTKVFEGPFRDMPHWAAEMRAFVAARGRSLQKLYYGYTTCPACARAYGRNYVVLVAKVD